MNWREAAFGLFILFAFALSFATAFVTFQQDVIADQVRRHVESQGLSDQLR